MEPGGTAVATEWTCKRRVTAGYRGDRGNETIEEFGEETFLYRPL